MRPSAGSMGQFHKHLANAKHIRHPYQILNPMGSAGGGGDGGVLGGGGGNDD